MRDDLVKQIANAVLYEGYLLYPYRRSAVKNQQRFNFGVLYPRAFAEIQTGHDAWSMQMECLAVVTPHSKLEVKARFLQLVKRDLGKLRQPVPKLENQNDYVYDQVDSLEIGNETFQSWQEVVEREVTSVQTVDSLRAPQHISFSFPVNRTCQPLSDGDDVVAVIVRQNELVSGQLEVSFYPRSESVWKLRIVLTNTGEFSATGRDAALLKSLLSAHLTVALNEGEFISLLEPPEWAQAEAAGCVNIGCWPVLVGPNNARDTMLAAPIILYDYPQVAPESPGDLFDATEIDEILSLRILTLTDDEKRELRGCDERARRLLQRTEELQAEQLLKLHGALRR